MNKRFKPIFWLIGSALGLAGGIAVMAADFSSLYVAPATFIISFFVTGIGCLMYKSTDNTAFTNREMSITNPK